MDRPSSRQGHVALASLIAAGAVTGLVAARAITGDDVWMTIAAGAGETTSSFDPGAVAANVLIGLVGLFGLCVTMGVTAAAAVGLAYRAGAATGRVWVTVGTAMWLVVSMWVLVGQDLGALVAVALGAAGWRPALRREPVARIVGGAVVLLALALVLWAGVGAHKVLAIASILSLPIAATLARVGERRLSPRVGLGLVGLLCAAAVVIAGATLLGPSHVAMRPERSIAFLRSCSAAGTLSADSETLGYTLWRLSPEVRRAEAAKDITIADITIVTRRGHEDLTPPAGATHILAFRSRDEAVFVRADAAGLVARVERAWEGLGVPFDRTVGLLVGPAIDKSPDWAAHAGLLPPEGPALLRLAQGGQSPERAAARAKLSGELFLAGDYVGAVEAARGALVDQPNEPTPLLWAARALVAQARTSEAVAALARARALGADTTALAAELSLTLP